MYVILTHFSANPERVQRLYAPSTLRLEFQTAIVRDCADSKSAEEAHEICKKVSNWLTYF